MDKCFKINMWKVIDTFIATTVSWVYFTQSDVNTKFIGNNLIWYPIYITPLFVLFSGCWYCEFKSIIENKVQLKSPGKTILEKFNIELCIMCQLKIGKENLRKLQRKRITLCGDICRNLVDYPKITILIMDDINLILTSHWRDFWWDIL